MAARVNFSCLDEDLSRNSTTEFVWSVDTIVTTDTGSRIATIIFLLLIFLLGVPSNLLLIGVIVKKRLYSNQPTVLLVTDSPAGEHKVCVWAISSFQGCRLLPWSMN